jgi:hypothetical protein
VFTPKNLTGAVLAIVLCSLFAATAPLYALGATGIVLHSAGSGRYDLLTGQAWRRMADPRHPSVPPRLVAVDISHAAGGPPRRARHVCLTAGDHLMLESAGAQSLVRMDAIALESGAAGEKVHARVIVTGAVVMATVIDARSGLLAEPAMTQVREQR